MDLRLKRAGKALHPYVTRLLSNICWHVYNVGAVEGLRVRSGRGRQGELKSCAPSSRSGATLLPLALQRWRPWRSRQILRGHPTRFASPWLR